MSSDMATSLGLEPLGAYRGMAVAGCEPDEMGIGPVFAIPKLLDYAGLTLNDIDLVELNEAFASQCLYCRDRLEIDNEKKKIYYEIHSRWPSRTVLEISYILLLFFLINLLFNFLFHIEIIFFSKFILYLNFEILLKS